MYKCEIKGTKVYLVEEEKIVAELEYSLCEGNVIVDWVNVDDGLRLKLGNGNSFENYFSVLKNVGLTLKGELKNQGIPTNRVLWGTFPEVRELDNFAKHVNEDLNVVEKVKLKSMR